MKQKTIGKKGEDYKRLSQFLFIFPDHERMSAGDPHHDHATCGGTTSVAAAQKQTDLLAEILGVAMSKHTKNIRLGFANARSGQVPL